MNVFFVYDSAFCKADEDDPKDAIVYFYPSQFSGSERYFLCCQLAGMAKFLKATFSSPCVIGLDQGKFAFLQSGNYLLVLGASHEILTSVLQDQLSFLCHIFCFYHGSINNVLKECKNNRQEFLSQSELAWSRYLSLSQCFGNVLQFSLNVLPLKTYRKSSGVVGIANRLLHLCQMNSSVIAGAAFYNSRVLSTQFMPQLTNFLSLLSNSNASASVSNTYHGIENLPPDVELKIVYLSSKLLSTILKYNHSCVGSRIRVKSTTTKTQSFFHGSSYKETVGSGSEGDIDSGNCSEWSQSIKQKMMPRQGPKHEILNEYKELWKEQCCTSHARVLARSLMRSQNPTSVILARDVAPNCQKGSECQGSTAVDFKKHSNATHVYCQSHAQMLASYLENRLDCHCSFFICWRDAEFQCSACSNYCNSSIPNAHSLKKWNSSSNLQDYPLFFSKPTTSSKSSTNSDNCFQVIEQTTKPTRLQILKCRSNSDSRFIHAKVGLSYQGSTKRHLSDFFGLGNQKRSAKSLDFDSCEADKELNIESNELQKFVLYVQRYGGSTLVLLLNKDYDDRVIDYVWNCGFTLLGQLERNSEKQPIELSLSKEASFFILLYNHSHRILKEFPRFPSALLSQKHSCELVQKILEDFKHNPYFQSICLLSSSYSIFATHKDENVVLYVQPEINCRKLEPLCNLQNKASRRTSKYFKIIF